MRERETDNAFASDALVGGPRWKPALAHLLLSAMVLAIMAVGLFFVWYPPPYASLSGGLRLFGLLALVDVFLGPLGTLVVSSPTKPQTEWRKDVTLIVLIQVAALTYGVWTVYQARPVYMAFEIDRFRAVHAVDVPVELLKNAPPQLHRLPVMGPGLIAVRPFHDMQEKTEVTMAALQGLDIGARPDLWMNYAQAVPQVLAAAKPVDVLMTKFPESRELIVQALEVAEMQARDVVYLPLVSRSTIWTVLLNKDSAQPLAYVPVDSFGP